LYGGARAWQWQRAASGAPRSFIEQQLWLYEIDPHHVWLITEAGLAYLESVGVQPVIEKLRFQHQLIQNRDAERERRPRPIFRCRRKPITLAVKAAL
jgi:hypothetical protein